MFGATTLRENPGLVAEWRPKMEAMHLPSMLHGIDCLVRRDSVISRLPEIEVPALVIVGAEDKSLPPALSREIAAGLPDSELVVVEGAGHLSALEQPAAVTGAMLEFVSRVR